MMNSIQMYCVSDNIITNLITWFCIVFFRMLLAYLLIPVVQKQLDVFMTVAWNSHTIRAQKGTALPDGIPDHIYSFSNTYGLEEWCMCIITIKYILHAHQ